jgi:hypothetical protein
MMQVLKSTVDFWLVKDFSYEERKFTCFLHSG